jgi:5-methylthioadenosine/S-adenosylhomocysteine deaminase
MSCFRGLADDLPVMAWLNDHIFPAEAKFIDPETVYLSALLGMAEMILSGTTTFCDGYFFEDETGNAAIQVGMRGVIARGFLDFPTPDDPDGLDKREKAESFLRRWQHRSPLVLPSLICHSLYTCSPETLQTIRDVANRFDVPLQIHLSETKEEIGIVRERYGKKPVEALDELGLLSPRLIAAHCIWVDDDELETLARYDIKVAHNPESNMKLGSGMAPVARMLKMGIDVGLGTDSCASNNDLDMFAEVRMAAKIQRLLYGETAATAAVQSLEMAASTGARVLGLNAHIGSISPGKDADIILVDINKPHLTSWSNPFSAVVYGAGGADVKTSIINGRVVMKDRRIITIEIEELMEKVRRIGKRIAGWKSLKC